MLRDVMDIKGIIMVDLDIKKDANNDTAGQIVHPESGLKLHFHRPPFWSGNVVGLLQGVGFGMLVSIIQAKLIGGGGNWVRAALAFCCLQAVVTIIAVIFRAATRPLTIPPVQAMDQHLLVPKNAGSTHVRSIKYEDILSVDEIGKGKRSNLFINTRGRLLGYPLRALSAPGAIRRLRKEIRRRLRNLPNGTVLVQQMEIRESTGRIIWARKPIATMVMLTLIIVVFLFEYISGVLNDPFGLVRYGANASTLVADGQVFRLIAANFLHANILHIWMNAIALYSLGAIVERLTGVWRFMLIYLFSALGGAIASVMVTQAAYSVGASTAIFGLLGSLGVINWRFRFVLPGGFRQPIQWWIIIICLNCALPFLLPQIDIAAHGGGFLAGIFMTLMLCTRKHFPQRDAGPAVKGLAMAMALLSIIGLGQAVLHACKPPVTDVTRVAYAFINNNAANPDLLNSFSWDYAIDPTAPPERLLLALHAANLATTRVPDKPEYFDTLATTYYRMGDFKQAVLTELHAIALICRQPRYKEKKQFYYSQLGRFLECLTKEQGPLEIGENARADCVKIHYRQSKKRKHKAGLVVEIDEAFPTGVEILALIKQKNNLWGVLSLLMGSNSNHQQYFFRLKKPFFAGMEKGLSFNVVLVDTRTQRPFKNTHWRWWYGPMDPKVSKLP